MKVALISPYQIADGVARYTAGLVNALQANYPDLDVEVVPWNYPSKLSRLVLPALRIVDIANRLSSANVVHIQFVASWYLYHLFLLLWLARVNNLKLKIVFTLHETNDNTPAPWFFNWLQNIYLVASDSIVVHSKYHKNLLPKHLHSKTIVIPLGVPIVGESTTQENTNLALLPGFINSWKGYDLTIKALDVLRHSLPQLRIMIVGRAHHSTCLAKLKSLAESLGLSSRVTFKTQFVPDKEFDQYFEEAGVVILPYRRIAMSAVLAQAIAHRKVTVMSDLEPFKEYTQKGGIYFKRGNYRDLAAKLKGAIGNSVTRGHQKNLFARLRREYGQVSVAKQTFEFYNRLYAD